MADLTSLANAKQWLGLTQNTDDALLTQLIAAASSLVRSYTKRDILLQAYTELRDGSGGSSLVVENYPITSISNVVVDGSVIASNRFNFSGARITFNDGNFSDGVNNVQVNYSAGFAVVPSDLEQAVIEIVGVKYRERGRIGQASFSLSGQNVSLLVDALPASVKLVLDMYKRVI